MLDQQTKEIIKSTIPVLKEHGVAITTAFYQDLFARYPEVKGLFSMQKQESGEQPNALARTILAAAENIDNLSVLAPAVQNIGKTHVNASVKPEHYPIVGECLLKALKTVLGEAATDEIISAWGKAYAEISKIFIEVENTMYAPQ